MFKSYEYTKHLSVVLCKKTSLAIFVTLATLLTLSPSGTNAAPFPCSEKFYQIINGVLSELDPQSGSYVSIGGTGAMTTNAAGYNIEDNYIYAWQDVDVWGGGVRGIVRINHDGSSESLGVPPLMPSDGSYVSGDFDHQGNLYIYSGTTSLYKIDVSAMTTTVINISAPMPVNDLVFINGKLYALTGTNLYQIDTVTGLVTTSPISITADPSNPTTVYGAGWTSSGDVLFFSRNSDGKIFKIDNYNTATPTASVVVDGSSANGNDGASCPLAKSPIEPIRAVNDNATTKKDVKLTVSAQLGVIANDTGRTLVVTSYTQPQNGTLVINPDGSYVYTPKAGFTGVDTATYTITDEFGQTETATLTISVDLVGVILAPKSGFSTELIIASLILGTIVILIIIIVHKTKLSGKKKSAK